MAAFLNGQFLNHNFRRIAKKLDFPITKNRQQDLRNFPIEAARLQVAIPFLYLSALAVIFYGWILDTEAPLAAALIITFIIGYSFTAAFNVFSVLLVEFYFKKPTTAPASNNLVRCLRGAGAKH